MSKQEQTEYKEWLAGLKHMEKAMVVQVDGKGDERIYRLVDVEIWGTKKARAWWGGMPARYVYFSRLTGKMFGEDDLFIRPWDDEQAKDYEEQKAVARQQWQERESEQREKEESQLLDRVRALDWETLLKNLSYREIGEFRHTLNMLEAKL